MTSIKENIEKKIESGKLRMRPRSYFILKGALVVLAAAALAALLLYLGSFAIYARLPLIPILAALLAAWGLERLLYNFAPAYRWPIAFSFGLLLLFALVGSIGLHRAGMHARIHRYVREREMPLVSPFYRHFGPPLPPPIMRR